MKWIAIFIFHAAALFANKAGAAGDSIPKAVAKSAQEHLKHNTRVFIEKTDGEEECDAGYRVSLQVKIARDFKSDGTIDYFWETEKVISMDESGNILELCER